MLRYITLGITNGLAGSLPMMFAPSKVPATLKEATGNMMTLSYNIGLTAGSLIGYVFDSMLGPPIVNPCPKFPFIATEAPINNTTTTTVASMRAIVTTLAAVTTTSTVFPPTRLTSTTLSPAIVSNNGTQLFNTTLAVVTTIATILAGETTSGNGLVTTTTLEDIVSTNSSSSFPLLSTALSVLNNSIAMTKPSLLHN